MNCGVVVVVVVVVVFVSHIPVLYVFIINHHPADNNQLSTVLLAMSMAATTYNTFLPPPCAGVNILKT